MGGGVKKLFRKIDNRSADYDPHHVGKVRRDSSYIYENFLYTGGTDVKIYAVGPRYAHAEARKSPVVDGRVVRTVDGKELRYPVILSPTEKEICRRVCLIFKQMVCGFDLLRCGGKSYVCDVNGWSFVKNAPKYNEDASRILRSIILCIHRPYSIVKSLSIRSIEEPDGGNIHVSDFDIACDLSQEELVHTARKFGTAEDDENNIQGDELRCVLAVVRHGDRTPKQKMKLTVNQPQLLNLMERHMDAKGKQAKLKTPLELQELLNITRELITLTQKKYRESEHDKDVSKDLIEKLRYIRAVLEERQFSGVNRKVQLKPVRYDTNENGDTVCVEALLVLKHGGVLTHAGRLQAQQFGTQFRTTMYPVQSSGGLLRLHSTYRHDFKIYSSDEGRVQTSAAAFTQGMLDLEGSALTPILASLVKQDAILLDAFGKGAEELIQNSKENLYSRLTYDKQTDKSYHVPIRKVESTTPVPSSPLEAKSDSFTLEEDHHTASSADCVKPPADSLSLLKSMQEMIKALLDTLHHMVEKELREEEELEKAEVNSKSEDENNSPLNKRSYSALLNHPNEWDLDPKRPCQGEKVLLLYDRWRKLYKGLYNDKKGLYDCSKIPDIYDAAKYDAIHNSHLGLPLRELYLVSRQLANCVIPGEYGTEKLLKRTIGSRICCQLLGKLLSDLENMRHESLLVESQLDSSEDEEDQVAMDIAHLEEMHQLEDESLPHLDNGEVNEEEETVHRLCPKSAAGINSPLRHVRTRIYFTSESHIHSIINVVRFAHLNRLDLNGAVSLLSDDGEKLIENTLELDYLSHMVIRLLERKSLPIEDPDRFRVEIIFSPGTSYDPFEVNNESLKQDHALPSVPAVPIHADGVNLERLNELLKPYAKIPVCTPLPPTTRERRNGSEHLYSPASPNN
eukprot:NODE_263_length_3101_cov_40.223304_g227_i0.p1 GENE.NODE_263_length_3101_cov_40.223304_g227_i0~~NODE_263_length_3101_cov_40.223304_g227_i0.p1  ORF type:complete len:959 (-),score=209.09 NODE_263_length_3101_cov_40.223304_g227_i0:224-2947(-)